ncbi:hypothetical protein DPMN_044765 [Dreissena polymorpha]|uniref:Uncharacterized protein n=1 Tax=Dreissena polymorpha TaxID=45954 RepID=A0A9D4D3J0_DREPO|nr:hypothetical protein DPMN_044765 [Dreissena polymorpha]
MTLYDRKGWPLNIVRPNRQDRPTATTIDIHVSSKRRGRRCNCKTLLGRAQDAINAAVTRYNSEERGNNVVLSNWSRS